MVLEIFHIFPYVIFPIDPSFECQLDKAGKV